MARTRKRKVFISVSVEAKASFRSSQHEKVGLGPGTAFVLVERASDDVETSRFSNMNHVTEISFVAELEVIIAPDKELGSNKY